MSLINVVLVLVAVGIVLWCINRFGAAVMDGKILRILNVVVVVAVVVWLLYLFGIWQRLGSVTIHPI
jgi:Na+-translocating ferredoxin:NAD+ oxidoreductase RnfA subunit